MKSKEMYVLGGLLVLVIAFVWWGSTREVEDVVVVEDTTKEETNTTPKPAVQKPSSSVTQKPSTSVNTTVTPEKPVPVVPTSQILNGSTLTLTTFNGSPVSTGAKYTLAFTENNFTLKLCNTLNSSYYIDGNVLKAGNVVSTKMYCGSPAGLMKMESDVQLMLNSGNTTIYRSGTTLILSHAQGTVLVFEGF